MSDATADRHPLVVDTTPVGLGDASGRGGNGVLELKVLVEGVTLDTPHVLLRSGADQAVREVKAALVDALVGATDGELSAPRVRLLCGGFELEPGAQSLAQFERCGVRSGAVLHCMVRESGGGDAHEGQQSPEGHRHDAAAVPNVVTPDVGWLLKPMLVVFFVCAWALVAGRPHLFEWRAKVLLAGLTGAFIFCFSRF